MGNPITLIKLHHRKYKVVLRWDFERMFILELYKNNTLNMTCFSLSKNPICWSWPLPGIFFSGPPIHINDALQRKRILLGVCIRLGIFQVTSQATLSLSHILEVCWGDTAKESWVPLICSLGPVKTPLLGQGFSSPPQV